MPRRRVKDGSDLVSASNPSEGDGELYVDSVRQAEIISELRLDNHKLLINHSRLFLFFHAFFAVSTLSLHWVKRETSVWAWLSELGIWMGLILEGDWYWKILKKEKEGMERKDGDVFKVVSPPSFKYHIIQGLLALPAFTYALSTRFGNEFAWIQCLPLIMIFIKAESGRSYGAMVEKISSLEGLQYRFSKV